jgi:membrane protease subunit (stomatin/prohibitin family)
MGSFGGSSTPDVVAGGLNQSPASGSGAGVSSGMLAVASMADAMKQFDSNGNMVANVVNTSVPSTKSLTLPGVPEAGNLFSANGTHHS